MAIVFAPAGVGLVLGSIFMPGITRRLGKSRTIFLGSISLAITVTLLALLSLIPLRFQFVQLAIAPFLMFAAGVEIDFINIPAQTAMQEQTPEWIKGRVLALQLMLYNAASIPVVLSIGGIADAFGVAQVIYTLAVCIIAFGLWGNYYERKPHRWSGYQIPQDEAEADSDVVEEQNAKALKK
jgi:MFS family permease